MSIRNKAIALAVLLLAVVSAHAEGIQGQFQDGINGAFSNGIWSPNNAAAVTPPPPPFLVPTVVVNTCNISVPVTTGVDVPLAAGGTCTYNALCGGLACSGGNATTGWSITAQSCADCFSIINSGSVSNSGELQGGANAANVLTASVYTVTVTAINAAGTSAPVTQTINTPGTRVAPVVAVNNCTINLPVSPGAQVTLQGGGNCSYTATCGGVSCVGGNTITGWALTAQSLANGFALDNSGNLKGGSASASLANNQTYTVTVAATNAIGTSPGVMQNVSTPIVPNCISYNTALCITWQTGAGNEITYN